MSDIKVLIVDDNKIYREAFKRNLLLNNYEICEAEHADEALKVMKEENPDVLVTDLRMRTATEGLDLIRQAKDIDPLLPVVMISAVGTFEEGAIATKLGAAYVISKSRIEDEMSRLYESINKAHFEYKKNREYQTRIQSIKNSLSEERQISKEEQEELRSLLLKDDMNPYLKGDIYDLLISQNEIELRKAAEAKMNEVLASPGKDEASLLNEIENEFKIKYKNYGSFTDDSKDSLKTAEFLYKEQNLGRTKVDFSRNIGFSYCFAVENEAKASLRKKLSRFLTNKDSYKIVNELLDKKTGHVDLFFHQYLLRFQQGKEFDFTIDNVKQTFHRILEHQAHYKPDGLKALGIMIICFGRDYSFKKFSQQITIANPLNIKGINSDEEVVDFAQLLISLQHYRNPYIHPEISEMEKISKIRETTFKCIEYISMISN